MRKEIIADLKNTPIEDSEKSPLGDLGVKKPTKLESSNKKPC